MQQPRKEFVPELKHRKLNQVGHGNPQCTTSQDEDCRYRHSGWLDMHEFPEKDRNVNQKWSMPEVDRIRVCPYMGASGSNLFCNSGQPFREQLANLQAKD